MISNLFAAVCEAADEQPVDVRGIQKANTGDGCPGERIVQTTSNEEVAEALASGEANLAGGTAWLWAREEMADKVDVLVCDEARQMSLANTLAVCQAAGSLVLLGDPRQLDQPIQGVHPPGQRAACQRAARVLRKATALRVTRPPPRGSDGSYGPCGPAWTGRPGRPRRLPDGQDSGGCGGPEPPSLGLQSAPITEGSPEATQP